MIKATDKKILFYIALFILTVSFVKNIYAIFQILSNHYPDAITKSIEAIIIGTAFFIIIGYVIRDVRWRVGWVMLILNEFLNIITIKLFKGGDITFSILTISSGIVALLIAAFYFYKYKTLSMINKSNGTS